MDLIYGLPFQTTASFEKTLHEIISMGPDRVALFSYAKVPWLKAHQKAIKEEWLPETLEKFKIYLLARKLFEQAGYFCLGMDHFAKKEDELAHGPLQRNFQGYTLKLAETMIPFGITAVGDVSQGYFQNVKELEAYYRELDANRLPIAKGIVLSDDDKMRRWVIHTLMCTLALNKNEFEQKFKKNFDHTFAALRSQIAHFEQERMVENNLDQLLIVGNGSWFIRNIVSLFDSYFNTNKVESLYSKAI